MGREGDHLQGIFRTTFELLSEAGKDVEWVSCDHPLHGYIYPVRGADGSYEVEDLLTGQRYTWKGVRNYVDLDPAARAGHVLRVVR